MMRLAIVVGLAGLCLPAMAQQFQAAKAPAPLAMPAVYTTPGKAHNARLDILNQERDRAQDALTEAVSALPKAPDMQEAIKGIARLQGDLQAIDREIASVEKQRPAAASYATRKPAVQAAGDLSPAPELAEAKQADAQYEAWDVFQNFGKKVNK